MFHQHVFVILLWGILMSPLTDPSFPVILLTTPLIPHTSQLVYYLIHRQLKS